MDRKERIILLGVGTGVPDAERGHTHMVWDGAGGPVLIDAGGSTYQRLLKAGVDPQELTAMVLTHSHADHINGIPPLLFSMELAGRKTPVSIFGLEPTLTLVRRILEAFALEDHAAPVEWFPIHAGDSIDLGAGRFIHTKLNDHPRPCLAMRFEQQATQQSLAYSGDTSPCQNVVDLAQGVPTLIHEATSARSSCVHTTPREAGEIARQAGVSRLVLVHYSPKWTMPEDQALEEARKSGFTGEVEIGREYQVLAFR